MLPPELEWTEEERELLRSAELDAPPTGARGRTLVALGVGGAVTTAAVVSGSAQAAQALAAPSTALSTAGVAAGGGKALVVAKWILFVTATGAASGAAWHYRAEIVPPPIAAPAAAPAAPAAKARAAAPEQPSTPVAASATPDAASEPSRSPAAPLASANHAEPDLAEEIASLDRARRASERRDFSGALAELDRYEHDFKQGRLRQEALLLRVQTMLGRGDSAGAKALGQRFLAKYPKSPLAPRMQKLIGGER